MKITHFGPEHQALTLAERAAADAKRGPTAPRHEAPMSDNLQIPPDLPLTVTVTLTAQHWFNLQRVLDQAPHGLVRPLLDAIQSQCMAQAARQRATRFPDGSLQGVPEGFRVGAPDDGEQ